MRWFKKKVKTLPHEAVLRAQSEKAELNIYSSTWQFVEQWQQEKLSAERQKNDAKRHDAIETAYIRGRISLLKELAELPEETSRNRLVETEPPYAGYGE